MVPDDQAIDTTAACRVFHGWSLVNWLVHQGFEAVHLLADDYDLFALQASTDNDSFTYLSTHYGGALEKFLNDWRPQGLSLWALMPPLHGTSVRASVFL